MPIAMRTRRDGSLCPLIALLCGGMDVQRGKGNGAGEVFSFTLAIILPGGEEGRGGRGVSRSTQSEEENEAEEERRKGLVCVILFVAGE